MSSSEATSQSVLGLVGHVSRLAHSSLPAPEFYTQFLDLLPVPAGTLGTVAWVCGDDSFSKIAAGTRTPNDSVQLPVSAGEHAAQLQETREAMTPKRFDPPETSGYQVYVENALPVIIVFPVIVEEGVPVVVEAYLPPDVPDNMTALFVRRTQLLCEIASNYHLDSTQSQSPEQISTTTMGLTPTVHESLSIVDTCYAVVNEGRRVTGSDRVTVLTRKGRNYKVEAVSGQESVNRRANVVQYLQRLVNRAMRTGEEFWYPQDAEKLPPEIESELEAFLEVSMSRVLGIVPLQRKPKETENEDEQTRNRIPKNEKPVGALVVEKFTEVVGSDEVFRQRTTTLATEASVALRNAVNHETIFLLPLWRWIGGLSRFFRGSALLKTVAALTGIAVAIAALILVPAELKINSDGRLMPQDRRRIFAQSQGTIDTLAVEHGSKVSEGDVLATIRNYQHDLELQQVRGEIRKTQAQIDSLQAKLLSKRSQNTDQNEIFAAHAEKENLEVLRENLGTQIEILKRKQSELQVVSPISGQVITWEVADRLRSRPVQPGQMMMEIANLDGEWCLELNLPDRRISDVLYANETSDTPLKVTYILASDTSKTLEGEVISIAKATRVDAEDGQHILVRVAIDEEQVPFLQPGTEIQAKVHCGQRKLGYVWLRDVWHFFKTRVLFPFS